MQLRYYKMGLQTEFVLISLDDMATAPARQLNNKVCKTFAPISRNLGSSYKAELCFTFK